ncbi:MAG: hypothetical protein QM523_08860 [Candidatus Pacebacteria bacterium]|nr:hypothetical protein [Candidatus Paceibacterota bacterium]
MQKTAKEIWLVLALLVLTVGLLGNVWSIWNLEHKWDSRTNNAASNSALEQSICAVTTGVVFASCDNQGNRVQFRDIIASHDLGEALFLNARAAIRGKPNRLTDLAQHNYLIIILGIVIMAVVVYSSQNILTLLAFLSVTLPIAATGLSPGYHAAHIGIAVLSITPALVMVFASSRSWSWLKYGLAMVLATLAFSIAAVFREVIALMGFLTLIVVAGLIVFKRPALKTWVFAAIAVVLTALFYKGQAMINYFGLWYYSLPPSSNVTGHGFGHALFLGLGEVPNKFGIVWNDSYGVQVGKQLNPMVEASSNDYYDLLRNQYFAVLQSDPLEVLRIYGAKLIKVSLDKGNLFFIVLAAGVYLYGGAMARKAVSNRSLLARQYLEYRLLGLIALLMIGLFTLQAVIINSGFIYFAPSQSFTTLLFALGLGQVLNQGVKS